MASSLSMQTTVQISALGSVHNYLTSSLTIQPIDAFYPVHLTFGQVMLRHPISQTDNVSPDVQSPRQEPIITPTTTLEDAFLIAPLIL